VVVPGAGCSCRPRRSLCGQARKQGGWVAGKVDLNTWHIRDVAEAQDSFFARCAKVMCRAGKPCALLPTARRRHQTRRPGRPGRPGRPCAHAAPRLRCRCAIPWTLRSRAPRWGIRGRKCSSSRRLASSRWLARPAPCIPASACTTAMLASFRRARRQVALWRAVVGSVPSAAAGALSRHARHRQM
jgi:hypothetical protein